MIFNEIKCHVNTSLGLVGRMHPLHPHCVRAWECLHFFCRFGVFITRHLSHFWGEVVFGFEKKLFWKYSKHRLIRIFAETG